MTDARLHPTFLTNHKIDELDDHVFRVYVNGIVLAASQETDGFIGRRALRMLHPEADVRACATALVGAGLWETDGEGWRIHDFLDYQTSKAQSEGLREAARLRKAKSRAGKSRRDKSDGHGVTDGQVTASHTGQDRDRTGQAQEGAEVNLWEQTKPTATCEVCGNAMPSDLAHREGWTHHPTCQPERKSA